MDTFIDIVGGFLSFIWFLVSAFFSLVLAIITMVASCGLITLAIVAGILTLFLI